MSGQYKVAWLCEALLVSRSGYYDWVERRRQPGPRQLENMRLRERIREEFARSRQTYGSPRLAHALGCPGRRNRIARLMRAERIFARQRSKYRPMTTDSRHGGPIAPNRLPSSRRPTARSSLGHRCHLHPHRPRLVISGRRPGCLYPARHRLGHAPNPRCSSRHRRPAHGLSTSDALSKPHHPLRSRQPSSPAPLTGRSSAQHGLIASMSRKGNCYDNAFIESFWSSLKYEVVYHQRFATFAEARTAIFDYIETFYNRTRLHSSLAYRSPINFESQLN